MRAQRCESGTTRIARGVTLPFLQPRSGERKTWRTWHARKRHACAWLSPCHGLRAEEFLSGCAEPTFRNPASRFVVEMSPASKSLKKSYIRSRLTGRRMRIEGSRVRRGCVVVVGTFIRAARDRQQPDKSGGTIASLG